MIIHHNRELQLQLEHYCTDKRTHADRDVESRETSIAHTFERSSLLRPFSPFVPEPSHPPLAISFLHPTAPSMPKPRSGTHVVTPHRRMNPPTLRRLLPRDCSIYPKKGHWSPWTLIESVDFVDGVDENRIHPAGESHLRPLRPQSPLCPHFQRIPRDPTAFFRFTTYRLNLSRSPSQKHGDNWLILNSTCRELAGRNQRIKMRVWSKTQP